MSVEKGTKNLTDAQKAALECAEDLNSKIYAPLLVVRYGQIDTFFASSSEEHGDISIIEVTCYGVTNTEVDLVEKEVEQVVEFNGGQPYAIPGIITKNKAYDIFHRTNKYSFGINPEDEEDDLDYELPDNLDF